MAIRESVKNGAVTGTVTDVAIQGLTFTTGLEDAVGDTESVTVAAAEQQSVKEEIFEEFDEAALDDVILATDTSGLNTTWLAETTRPGQAVGTHWFNPPMLMELAEGVMTEHTPDGVADTAEEIIGSFN